MLITDLIHEHESLARYTSWKIGGPARFFANAQSPEQMTALLTWARERELPTFVLGGGSNSLIRDAGFPGLVLRYRASEIEISDHGDLVTVTIDAGAPTAGSVRRIVRQGIAGIEWAEGLPGTIGGALYGNAGCYGGDIASILSRAWVLVDGEIEEWSVAKFAYGYRTSALKQAGARGEGSGLIAKSKNIDPLGHPHPSPLPCAGEGIRLPLLAGEGWGEGVNSSALRYSSVLLNPTILRAEFALHRADPQELVRKMAETSEVRRGKTPSGQSCGSVFKNPPGDSAGRLIEAVGLKGARIGGAEVAEKHANYIINRGGATAADVLELTDLMRERVQKEQGIELELEVQIV